MRIFVISLLLIVLCLFSSACNNASANFEKETVVITDNLALIKFDDEDTLLIANDFTLDSQNGRIDELLNNAGVTEISYLVINAINENDYTRISTFVTNHAVKRAIIADALDMPNLNIDGCVFDYNSTLAVIEGDNYSISVVHPNTSICKDNHLSVVITFGDKIVSFMSGNSEDINSACSFITSTLINTNSVDFLYLSTTADADLTYALTTLNPKVLYLSDNLKADTLKLVRATLPNAKLYLENFYKTLNLKLNDSGFSAII